MFSNTVLPLNISTPSHITTVVPEKNVQSTNSLFRLVCCCFAATTDENTIIASTPSFSMKGRVTKESIEETKTVEHDPISYKAISLLLAHMSSLKDIDRVFLDIRQELSLHRYKGMVETKAEIIHILRSQVSLVIANTVGKIIDRICFLFADLKMYYHDVQHTLEVALGTTRAAVEIGLEQGALDENHILLAVVAALFHDIGYSNAPEALAYIKVLPREEYLSLFEEVKGRGFVQEFETLIEFVKTDKACMGPEFHPYHVYLGQIMMKHFIQTMPAFLNKEYLLEEKSLAIMGAMISLTDIKADSLEYRKKKEIYLEEQGCLLFGKALAESDLLTQLSTADRLKKGLSLYHEFYLGGDSEPWNSGLELLSSVTGFYDFFAKKLLADGPIEYFSNYFARIQEVDYYKSSLNLILSLYAAFEIVFKALKDGSQITEVHFAILKGLQENGLDSAVLDLFQAIASVRKGKIIEETLLRRLERVLEDKNSVLEVAIGDEIRVTLILDAALRQNTDKIKDILSKNSFCKVAILKQHRSSDFKEALKIIEKYDPEFIQSMSGF